MPNKTYLPDLTGRSPGFRVDSPAQVRFAGEYTALLTGMTFSGMIERGVIAVANEESERRGKSWMALWERAEGNPSAAWLLMYAENHHFDEKSQRLHDFLRAHEVFFFAREGGKLLPKVRAIEVLYKYVADFTLPDHWTKTKSHDSYATAERMADLLKKAKLKPPPFGPNVP